MNFRFVDDLVGSAPGVSASQEFRCREGKHSEKITQQRLLKIFWKIYIKY